MNTESPFAPVEMAIDAFRRGEMVVIVDDEDRENEGDVVIAAEFCTDEHINFMATHARGLICMTMLPDQCERLGLDLMVPKNGTMYETAFTVSIEAAHGVTTGISAADRAHTIRTAANPEAVPGDIIQPGHVFPLRAKENGILSRTGQTEGSVDLARLAGLNPVSVICEIMKDDGTMARVPDLIEFCKEHGLVMVSIQDMIYYRRKTELHVRQEAAATLPTRYGEFTLTGFVDEVTGDPITVLSMGDIAGADSVLTRVHSACLTGDIFHSERCDCGNQLEYSLEMIARKGTGVFIYLEQEGRGIGIIEKIKAYALQEQGLDTVEANLELGHKPDLREYHMAAHVLKSLEVGSIRLLTNNPDKEAQIRFYGMPITECVPMALQKTAHNATYLQTKQAKMGHTITPGGPTRRFVRSNEATPVK